MTQTNLFEEPLVSPFAKALRTPIAATNDPRTSHLAAREVTESGRRESQLEKVLELVRKYPLSTSAELAKFGRMDRYITARRLPELWEGKLVCQRSARICSVSSRKAMTWEAV